MKGGGVGCGRGGVQDDDHRGPGVRALIDGDVLVCVAYAGVVADVAWTDEEAIVLESVIGVIVGPAVGICPGGLRVEGVVDVAWTDEEAIVLESVIGVIVGPAVGICPGGLRVEGVVDVEQTLLIGGDSVGQGAR